MLYGVEVFCEGENIENQTKPVKFFQVEIDEMESSKQVFERNNLT